MTFDKALRLGKLRSSSKHPLLSIWDGSYYLHRADSSMPRYTNGNGIPCGAVAGVLSMVCSDYSALRPDFVAISFDVPGHNFRHRILESYKYNDPLDSDRADIGLQMLILVRLFRLLGVPTLFLQGVESDDVIGSLSENAKQICNTEVNTVVFSADKDIQQFVNGRVKTVDTRGEGWIGTPKSVREKFGVDPAQISDYLSLVGDSNDGIPGVQGIGPGKARELLNEYGSVPAILKAKKHGKWGKYLTPVALAGLRRDYSLSKIRTDVNVAKYGPFTLHPAHPVYLQQALTALGIRRLPSLVKAQLDAASLVGSSLFEGDTKQAPLVETSEEWDGLMGSIWKHTEPAWQKASFKDE